ncbi:MAG: hypothetical protein E6J62_20195 [Deltaproteobacteria bacterium]|nr:MAG: hypothetical protein E6J85_13335 [Deltaproteobacteria bacterium]TMB26731.1 MAG: hypothetical protein E6J62_20195 [Deltaproteobacteria bacterium]TMB29755.1 MAG: hypothetical protein E6J61_14495 [Deltaproteobacteria bacterium]
MTFVIVFLLPIFLVPGGTERPEAAAAGFCYISNHGHSYQVDCWRWHIAHWCERGLLAFVLLGFLYTAVRALVRKACRLFADSSRASP